MIPGTNVLLMGPSGTGKTYSIGTLVDSGIETFYLALEPGLESLLGYWTDQGQSVPPNLHWTSVEAPTASFDALLAGAQDISTLSLDALAKKVDFNRAKHSTYVNLLSTLSNFRDARTDRTFGSVDSWGPDRALVIDGLTGVCRAAMSLVVGNKPVKSMADWGLAQDQIERLLRMLCDNCACHFVLIAHVEREVDQVLGGTKIMASALGKALAPKIPAMFSDVILAEREGTKWSWNTAAATADVKTRNLAISAGLPPDFRPVLARWKTRAAAASSPAPAVPSSTAA